MVYAGRGGFGNYTRSPKIAARETPESPELQALNRVPTSPAPIQHFTSPNQTFRAGRGGFGNNIPVTRMHTMTPAEYLKEVNDAVNVEPSIYAVGRGGRGNMVSRKNKSSESDKSNSVRPIWSLRSNKSNDGENGIWTKLKATISN